MSRFNGDVPETDEELYRRMQRTQTQRANAAARRKRQQQQEQQARRDAMRDMRMEGFA